MPTPEWCSWFAGLVDGEGCFLIHSVHGRWCAAKLVINMRADDRPMLEEIRKELGFGSLTFRPRSHGNGKPTLVYQVSKASELLALVHLFDRSPLRSRKRKDYEVWRTFVLLHQSRHNATDPRIEALLHEIKAVRVYEDPS